MRKVQSIWARLVHIQMITMALRVVSCQRDHHNLNGARLLAGTPRRPAVHTVAHRPDLCLTALAGSPSALACAVPASIFGCQSPWEACMTGSMRTEKSLAQNPGCRLQATFCDYCTLTAVLLGQLLYACASDAAEFAVTVKTAHKYCKADDGGDVTGDAGGSCLAAVGHPLVGTSAAGMAASPGAAWPLAAHRRW